MLVELLRSITKLHEGTIMPTRKTIRAREGGVRSQSNDAHCRRRIRLRVRGEEQTPDLGACRIGPDHDAAPRVHTDQYEDVRASVGGLEIDRAPAPVSHGEVDEAGAVVRPEDVFLTVRVSLDLWHLAGPSPDAEHESC